jgi:hypothetical protein
MSETKKPEYDIFISYSHDDREFSRKLAERLIKSDIRVWFDLWSIRPGQSWIEAIHGALESETALFIIGRGGVAHWQSSELQATLAKSVENPNMRLVPVLAPGATKEDIPLFLRAYRYLDLRKWSDKEFDRLVDFLQVHHSARQKMLRPPTVFLCHAKEDGARIERLYFDLRDRNLDPWYDKAKLVVGDHWREEILNAIKRSDFFAVFLSKLSARKEGFIQREIRTAIGEYQRKPYGLAYFLPVRLEECEVPYLRLDEQTMLADLQWIDLFEDDVDATARLVSEIATQWAKRNAGASPD